MTFDYHWWHSGAFELQSDLARRQCAASRFPDIKTDELAAHAEAAKFAAELDTRTVVYLRDGFSYEVRTLLNMRNTSYLTFECVATDEAYKVGAFVVSVPFDEICRVETFAVHPNERPDDAPTIKGFGGTPSGGNVRGEDRTQRSDGWENQDRTD